MINRELINPQSIVVVGGSNNVHKPGGRIVRNLLDGKYKGELCVVNAKETDVQGVKSYPSVHDIPETELAIISIPSKSCVTARSYIPLTKSVPKNIRSFTWSTSPAKLFSTGSTAQSQSPFSTAS